jgi:hypothetical protein
VEMINCELIKTELDELESDYKLESGQLYLMTDRGWRKPFIYIPSSEPVNSYWGKPGGKNYTDVFLFFESEKIIPQKEDSETSNNDSH